MLNGAQIPTNSEFQTKTPADCPGIALPAKHSLVYMEGAAFADGFRCGQRECESQDADHWNILTDTQFTERIPHHLPRKLRKEEDINEWRRGYIFGWTLAFYHLPLHNEGYCEDRDAVVQRVTILGSWEDVDTERKRILRRVADRRDIEFGEWGKTTQLAAHLSWWSG